MTEHDTTDDTPGHLKVELSLQGVQLDPPLRAQLFGTSTADAIDLLLPEDVWAQAPTEEKFTATSPFVLGLEAEGFLLRRRDGGRKPLEVRVLAPPDFYRRTTSRGTPMAEIAAVHGSFVALDPGAACGFGSRGTPCAFCGGSGAPADAKLPAIPEVLETVRAAFDEGAAEFVYFQGRCTDAEDGGIGALQPYILAVKKHFNTLIAAQLMPPRDARDIDRTYAMGVDAVSYNLEIFDPATLERHCPGRARHLGRDRILEALRHAASIFPSGTTWTELVLGLEPVESTRAAIEALAAIGVLPVLSVAGPAAAEAGLPRPSAGELAPIYAHLYRTVKQHRTPMTWVRDLPIGITPLDARFFVDAASRSSTQSFYRSRLGTIAARSLSRLRRRLRVKTVSDSFDSSHL